jgi:hypothetical protein
MTTTLVIPITAYDQVVRLKVSRTAYDALVESLGDDGHVRLAYDGEYLEIMSPGPLHEIRVIAGLPIAEIKRRVEDQAPRDEADMYVFRREWQQWLREHAHLHDNVS